MTNSKATGRGGRAVQAAGRAAGRRAEPGERGTRQGGALADGADARPILVGYVRGSKDDQSITIEAQTVRIEAYAAAMDLRLARVIVDSGESGKSLDRPGLREALAMVASGEVSGLIVAKLDRLTRSVKDLGALIEGPFAKAALLSVADSIDTRTAVGRLMLNVLASVAQWERETIVERTIDALAHKRSRGELIGKAPFGFRSVERDGVKVLAEDAGEQATIATILSARARGVTFAAIKAMGLPSRTGEPLGMNTIHTIVTRGNVAA